MISTASGDFFFTDATTLAQISRCSLVQIPGTLSVPSDVSDIPVASVISNPPWVVLCV
jgi:hypothetical protein